MNTLYTDVDYWVPGYSEGDEDGAPFSPLDTVITQYRNSPTILQLIANFSQCVDTSADFQNLYDNVLNIQTAQGFGLDILGRIIGVSRQLTVPAIYPVTVAPGLRNLTDDQYRTLLYAKALNNISGSSSADINAVLRMLFAGRGNAFALDLGNMQLRYSLLFALEPHEFAIMAQSNAVPRPAAVESSMQVVQSYFGFGEALSWSTFGESPFAAY